MRLIGIHGKANSGKGELAKVLNLTYGFKVVSLADKVKEFAKLYFGVVEDEFEKKNKIVRKIYQGIGSCVRDSIYKVAKYTPEELIGVSKHFVWIEDMAVDYFGVEYTQLKSRQIYVNRVLNGLSEMWKNHIDDFVNIAEGDSSSIWINYLIPQLTEDVVYIISDIRLRNEKKVIENNNGKMVKITRLDRPPIEIGANHISEIDLDTDIRWDYLIFNEHKTDWYNLLVLDCANMIRKFDNENFFTKKDKEKFNIKLRPHE